MNDNKDNRVEEAKRLLKLLMFIQKLKEQGFIEEEKEGENNV